MGDCFAPLGPPLLPWDLMAHTDRTTDMATPRPTRPSGAELVKIHKLEKIGIRIHSRFYTLLCAGMDRISYHHTGPDSQKWDAL